MLWRPLEGNDLPGPHYSGKVAIVGHTPAKNGHILDLGHLEVHLTRVADTARSLNGLARCEPKDFWQD